MNSWVTAAKRIDLLQVAAELELQVYRGGYLGPCPACGEQTRSGHDRRLGVLYLLRNARWMCVRCDARGDSIDLVSYALTQRRLDKLGGSNVVREWFASRGWCDPARGERPTVPRVQPKPPPKAPPPKHPAPRAEVEDLWSRCLPVTEASAVADWLRSRAIDPVLVEDRVLARALPSHGALPIWARHWRSVPCPVLVPLYDADGLVGLQGRRVDGGSPKSVAAKGIARRGIYACGWGRQLLSGEASWAGRVVIVTEGEPDWLTWATRVADEPDAPVVLGLPGGGAWTPQIAERIPSGTRVAVRTHDDPPGHQYARLVYESLRSRCTVLVRRGAFA